MADNDGTRAEGGEGLDPLLNEHHVTHGETEQPTLTRKVLIATDASVISADAFKYYVESIHRPENRVLVINIVEPPSMNALNAASGFGAATYEWKRECDQKMKDAKELQQLYALRMKESGLHGKCVIFCDDKPGQGIVKYAHGEDVDFIVIGSRGLGKLRRTFLGSHSSYVVDHAHIPVLVVPPEDRHAKT